LAEFDLNDEKVWTIPPERSKNNRAHRVPLSPLALSIVQTAMDLTGDSPWLFPSRTGAEHITPHAVSHAMRNARLGDQPSIALDNITPHDLRRTAASFITSLGVNRVTVAKILNHADGSVTAVYDRHSYDPEKRHALDAWAARLQEIINNKPSSTNVVPLATGADKI
jgi:integrase